MSGGNGATLLLARGRIALLAFVATAVGLPACSATPSGPSPAVADASATQPAATTSGVNSTELGVPASSGHFGTLPVGATLPSDEECASRVRSAPEVRSRNTPFNQTRGHGTPANPPSPLFGRVTGNFTGTTDEIIQWASCKWGIDEDIVRAQVAKESYWNQDAAGDFSTDRKSCAPEHSIGSDPDHPNECAQSVGLLQVRYPYWGWAFPDSGTSSAYNIDVSLAARRNCFEGHEAWLNDYEPGQPYAAGEIWGCVGMWFTGRWYTPDAKEYIAAVQDWVRQRIWQTPGFIAYTG